MSQPFLRTPLHGWHVTHGARLIVFGGWEMPLQYTSGILAEHRATRNTAALFDVSHMGRIDVLGPDATALLQRTTTNDVAALRPGRGQYSLVCTPAGGTLDDVVVFALADRYRVVVNAANRERDLAWWREQAAAQQLDVRLEDRTFAEALIALQGPLAQPALQPLTSFPLDDLRYYGVVAAPVLGEATLIARTGYTGEDGFELTVPLTAAVPVWEALLARAEPAAPQPAGLGARDTLRLEAGYPLYGHELTEDVTPLEAGLARYVKLDKGDFVGRDALVAQQAAGVTRRLVGFVMLDSAIPRQGYAVVQPGATDDTAAVGVVTSGSYGPSVERGIGLAYVPPALAGEGTEIGIRVRGQTARAQVVRLPFWPHRTRRGQGRGEAPGPG